MVKKILLLMLISLGAFSSSKTLIQDINLMYSSEIYRSSSPIKIIDFQSDRVQNNIKEDFEKLLPLYLKSENIFSKNSIKELRAHNIEEFKWNKFIEVSIAYMEYLKSEGRHEEAKKLLQKNLIDTQSLMLNSDSFLDYILTLSVYEKIYSSKALSSEMFISLFKKYPPPDKQLFFKKADLERKSIFELIHEMGEADIKSSIDIANYEKFMKQVKKSAKNSVDIYFDKMIIAIKSESIEKMGNFSKYMENERRISTSIWSSIKLWFHAIVANILQIFIGYNFQHDHIAKHVGNILALATIPNIQNLYTKHIEIIEKQNALIGDSLYTVSQ